MSDNWIATTSFSKAPYIGVLAAIGAALLLLLLAVGRNVMAQAGDPPWLHNDNLTCAPEHQQYQGLEYCIGLNNDAHVLVVDLHDESGLRLEYVIADGYNRNGEFGECRDVNRKLKSSGPGCNPIDEYGQIIDNYYPVMSLGDAVARYPATAAVVNTDYGAGTQDQPRSRDHGPEGLTIVHGDRIDGPLVGDTDNNAVLRPWVAIGESAPFQVEFGQLSSLSSDNGDKPETWMYTAFGGAPWLIRSGVPEDNILECRGANKEGTGACTSTVAQTAVAISEDGRWLYLVVANGVNAVGITGFITRTLQPQEAIKLDGGGSSQMWYGGLPEDQRVVDPGDGRQLSQYLAIIAPSGDGIDLEPPTPEPPPGSGNWWDSLLQNIEQRWEGILSWWDSLPQNIRQWWESTLGGFQQRMSEWWQRQQEELKRRMLEELEQAISQLCATAAIPGSIVTVFWIQNRRRRRRG